MASAASSASRFNRSWERIHRTWLRVQPELGRHPTVQQFYELLFDGYVVGPVSMSVRSLAHLRLR